MSPAEVDALSARLQHPTHDPHGDPIPTAEGEFTGQPGVPLTTAPLDQPLRILHMEDEPKAVYAQLVAVDLHPGMPVRLVEASPERVRLVAGGREHILAPLVGRQRLGRRRWRRRSRLMNRSANRSALSSRAKTGGF